MIICLVQVLCYIGLLVALFQLWHFLGQQFSLEFKLVCRPGKITSVTLTKVLRKYVPGVKGRYKHAGNAVVMFFSTQSLLARKFIYSSTCVL